MMGRTHALTGVLAASGTALFTGASVPSGLLLLTLLPGIALLNDIDHPDATASRSFGGLTRIPSLFLGHRRETHSLPGIAAFAVGTHIAVINQGNVVANCWLTFILAIGWLAVFKLLKIDGLWRWAPILAALFIAWWPEHLAVVNIHFPLDVLPWAVALGMLVHLAGDVITKQGCPLMWPFSAKKTRLGWFKTNGFGESIATGVILLAIVTSSGMWFLVITTGSPVFAK